MADQCYPVTFSSILIDFWNIASYSVLRHFQQCTDMRHDRGPLGGKALLISILFCLTLIFCQFIMIYWTFFNFELWSEKTILQECWVTCLIVKLVLRGNGDVSTFATVLCNLFCYIPLNIIYIFVSKWLISFFF